jgi:hypothetical protein
MRNLEEFVLSSIRLSGEPFRFESKSLQLCYLRVLLFKSISVCSFIKSETLLRRTAARRHSHLARDTSVN